MSLEPADHAVVQSCLDVMRQSEAMYLTSLDDEGAPCTRAVFNLRRESQFPGLRGLFSSPENPLRVYVATNTSSEKVRQLGNDPRVSFYYCLPATFHGVMLSGRVTEITDQGVKDRIWQDGWEIYYPSGRGDPDYMLLELRPTRARGWLCGKAFDVSLGEA